MRAPVRSRAAHDVPNASWHLDVPCSAQEAIHLAELYDGDWIRVIPHGHPGTGASTLAHRIRAAGLDATSHYDHVYLRTDQHLDIWSAP